MKAEDLDALVGIDAKLLKTSRSEYFEMRFDMLFKSMDFLPTSLVAETEDGTVVGFIMGELYMGEYGIFQEEATLDTIGVNPDYQHQGIGEQLINAYVDHLQSLGVHTISTLVDRNNSRLSQFFNANQFSPAETISLKRSI